MNRSLALLAKTLGVIFKRRAREGVWPERAEASRDGNRCGMRSCNGAGGCWTAGPQHRQCCRGPHVRPKVKVGTAASPSGPPWALRAVRRHPWAPGTRGPQLRPKSDSHKCLRTRPCSSWRAKSAPVENHGLTSIFSSLAVGVRCRPVGSYRSHGGVGGGSEIRRPGPHAHRSCSDGPMCAVGRGALASSQVMPLGSQPL